MIKSCCTALHKQFSRLTRYYFPFDQDKIPPDGIYILFEKGETGHGQDRIVRIGTHTGAHRLPARLLEHFIVENKDRSIFRKHIGRAILTRDKDPFLKQWEWDLTPSANRRKYSSTLNLKRQSETEKRVSQYIRDNLSFVILPVKGKEIRLALEAGLIGEISSCTECGPSDFWLGKYAPDKRIQKSGLWQIQKVFGPGLSYNAMDKIKRIFNKIEQP